MSAERNNWKCGRTFSSAAVATLAILLAGAVLLAPWQARAADQARIKAFPGAEGAGAYAKGGRGGQVIYVTNLEDYAGGSPIPGSLRAAIETKGPRTVVFAVSGTIALKTGLTIREPYLTIAGQTAPGGGICVKNHETHVSSHDVIIRHVRFRPGDEPGEERRAQGKAYQPDSLAVSKNSKDIIFDHCSASWAIDEVLSVSGPNIDGVTVQWCIISESLNKSFHQKGGHGYGSLVRADGAVSFHHNLYAHHFNRVPRPGTYGKTTIQFDFRNNVIYNGRGYTSGDPADMNYVGNYIKPGPDHKGPKFFKIGSEKTRIYADGNFIEGVSGPGWKDWDLIWGDVTDANRMDKPFPAAPVSTDSAKEAYKKVLASAGATLPQRDAVDKRIIEDVEKGTGSLLNSQTDKGGFPELTSAPPPTDTDKDGMPDAWEKQHGLDPLDPSDGPKDKDGDGYTNLEEFLNGTNPGKAE